jgi:hypothetical protein
MTTPYGILIRGAQFQTPTGTGNVTHAVNLEGLTPKAAMLYLNHHNPADGAAHTNHAQACLGVTDGTHHRYAGASSENNVSFTNDFSFQGNNHVLRMVNPTTGATLVAADFVSFTANSITLNYTAADVVAHEGILILFTGNDLTAFVGDTGSLGNAAGTHNVVTPFHADSIFMFGTHDAVSAVDATTNKFAFVIGMDNKTHQFGPGSHMVFEPDNTSAATGAAGRPQSTPGFHLLTVQDGIFAAQIHVDATYNVGSVDFVVDGAMANAAFPFLMLNIGNWWVSSFESWDSSTVTGIIPWIGGYIEQAFIALTTSHDTTFGALTDTSLSGGIGLGFMGNDGQQWSGMTQIDNTGQNVTKTKSLLRNLGYFVASPDADAIVEGSIDLLVDPTNIHFTTVTPTSRRTYFWGMHFPNVLPAFLDDGSSVLYAPDFVLSGAPIEGVYAIAIPGEVEIAIPPFIPPRPPQGWVVDLLDDQDNPVVSGIPLVTGANLLEQYDYLNFGGQLIVQTDHDVDKIPTFENLGDECHLYFSVVDADGMRDVFEIPTSAKPQTFSIDLGGAGYTVNLYWVETK